MVSSADLFSPVVEADKLHPQFVELRRSALHAKPRALMNTLFGRMGNPNGHFVRDFQTHGFHAGVFELACFAYLEEAGLSIDRTYASPDFMACGKGSRVAVEAVTANPAAGQSRDVSLRQMVELSEAEVFEKVNGEFPERIGRSLKKKIARAYQDLPHCRDIPLVFMIDPFFEGGANFYTDDALVHFLFGAPEGMPNILPPFFQQGQARSVSAVLYCNAFTVSRFLRLSFDFADQDAPEALRQGFCYRAAGEENHALASFVHKLGSPDVPKETWAEGVTVFENPFADVPVPPGLLPGTSRMFVEDDCVCRTVSVFHPVVSSMRIYSESNDDMSPA